MINENDNEKTPRPDINFMDGSKLVDNVLIVDKDTNVIFDNPETLESSGPFVSFLPPGTPVEQTPLSVSPGNVLSPEEIQSKINQLQEMGVSAANLINQQNEKVKTLQQTIRALQINNEKFSVETLKKKIKLVYYEPNEDGTETEKFIECDIAIASGDVRSRLNTLSYLYSKELENANNEFKAKYNSLEESGNDALADNVSMTVEYQNKVDEIKIRFMPQMAQVIINQRQLITAHKALVNGSYDSEFWKNQDTEVLEKFYLSFRLSYQKG